MVKGQYQPSVFLEEAFEKWHTFIQNEFSVFQKEANCFAKMEEKETSFRILIPRAFETID